jgi:hypothetical protein
MEDMHTKIETNSEEYYFLWSSARLLKELIEPLSLFNSNDALLRLNKENRFLYLQVVDRNRRCVIERKFMNKIDFTMVSSRDELIKHLKMKDASTGLTDKSSSVGNEDDLTNLKDVSTSVPGMLTNLKDVSTSAPGMLTNLKDASTAAVTLNQEIRLHLDMGLLNQIVLKNTSNNNHTHNGANTIINPVTQTSMSSSKFDEYSLEEIEKREIPVVKQEPNDDDEDYDNEKEKETDKEMYNNNDEQQESFKTKVKQQRPATAEYRVTKAPCVNTVYPEEQILFKIANNRLWITKWYKRQFAEHVIYNPKEWTNVSTIDYLKNNQNKNDTTINHFNKNIIWSIWDNNKKKTTDAVSDNKEEDEWEGIDEENTNENKEQTIGNPLKTTYFDVGSAVSQLHKNGNYAKVSMKFTLDLQDDFINLGLIGTRCTIKVNIPKHSDSHTTGVDVDMVNGLNGSNNGLNGSNNGLNGSNNGLNGSNNGHGLNGSNNRPSVELSCKYHSGTNGHIIQYSEQSKQGLSPSPTTTTTSKDIIVPTMTTTTTTNKKHKEEKKMNHKKKTINNAFITTPSSSSSSFSSMSMSSNPSRLTIEWFPNSHSNLVNSNEIKSEFTIRGIRTLHKLLGTSSRIEWLVAHNQPVIISFYSGLGPAERQTATMIAL